MKVAFIFYSPEWEGGGGGYSAKFYTGRPGRDVQSLIPLYTIFYRKVTPFIYLLLTDSIPFIPSFENCMTLIAVNVPSFE